MDGNMLAAAAAEKLEHALQVLMSLENMKSREFICDFQIRVGNQSFNTHRALLASCSGYFEALFSSNMREAKDGYITMKDVEASAIEECIRYMYTGMCNMEMDSVEGILYASNLLQIQSLEKKCCNFLRENLRAENCLFILNLARTFNHQDVEEDAEFTFAYNLKTVISSDLFLNISKEDLLQCITYNGNEAWRAIKTWCRGRENEFEELAEQINFSSFPFEILLNEVISDPLVYKSQKIKLIVQQFFSNPARLTKFLHSSNCFCLKKFATDKKSNMVIDAFMCRKFSTIITDSQFCNLSKDEVIRLLTSPEVDSEESKWEASLKWVKHDPKLRMTVFPDLFSSLNLLNFPLSFLEETVLNEELIKTSMPCMNLLMDAITNYAANKSAICYKRQPPGGEAECDGQGIQYSDCGFEYWLPHSGDVLDRLKTAFDERKLFKLKHNLGSDDGEIVLGDIPLDSEICWSIFDPGYEEYMKMLSHELEKKGF